MNPRAVGIEPDDLEKFLTLIESLEQWTCSQECLNQRQEKISAWSVGQQLDHLLLADQLNLKAVRMLGMGRGQESSDGLNEAGLLVFTSGIIPLGKSTAPDFVIPREDPGADALEQLRQDVLGGWQEVAPRLDEIDSRGLVLTHHAVGELGAWQWLRFARIHTQHHRNIAERILAQESAAS